MKHQKNIYPPVVRVTSAKDCMDRENRTVINREETKLHVENECTHAHLHSNVQKQDACINNQDSSTRSNNMKIVDETSNVKKKIKKKQNTPLKLSRLRKPLKNEQLLSNYFEWNKTSEKQQLTKFRIVSDPTLSPASNSSSLMITSETVDTKSIGRYKHDLNVDSQQDTFSFDNIFTQNEEYSSPLNDPHFGYKPHSLEYEQHNANRTPTHQLSVSESLLLLRVILEHRQETESCHHK